MVIFNVKFRKEKYAKVSIVPEMRQIDGVGNAASESALDERMKERAEIASNAAKRKRKVCGLQEKRIEAWQQ